MGEPATARGISEHWEALNFRQKKTLILAGTFFVVWFVLLFNPWTSPPAGFNRFADGMSGSTPGLPGVAAGIGKSVSTHGGPRTAAGAAIAAAVLPLVWRLDFWIWVATTIGLVLYHHDWMPAQNLASTTPRGLAVVITNIDAMRQSQPQSAWQVELELPLQDLTNARDIQHQGKYYSLDSASTLRFRENLKRSPGGLQDGVLPPAAGPRLAGRRLDQVFLYLPKKA